MRRASTAKRQDTRISGIEGKVRRKLKARAGRNSILLFGLGMFGLVGWSVVIPTLLGITLGLWIDRSWPSRFSWTLMLLVLGALLGSINAWHWVKGQSPRDDQESGETS